MKIDLLSSATMVERAVQFVESHDKTTAQKHDYEDQGLKDQNEVEKQY